MDLEFHLENVNIIRVALVYHYCGTLSLACPRVDPWAYQGDGDMLGNTRGWNGFFVPG